MHFSRFSGLPLVAVPARKKKPRKLGAASYSFSQSAKAKRSDHFYLFLLSSNDLSLPILTNDNYRNSLCGLSTVFALFFRPGINYYTGFVFFRNAFVILHRGKAQFSNVAGGALSDGEKSSGFTCNRILFRSA